MKNLIALLFVFTLSIPLGAQSFFEKIVWSYNGSLFLFAADNGPGADPAQIVPSFGFSAAYPIAGPVCIEFTEDIYFSNYEYNFARGYPMACAPENRKAFVIGFTTGIQVTGNFPIGNKGVAIRAFAGPVADLRLVVKAIGLHPDDSVIAQTHTDAITNYFWSDGRMMFAITGAGIDFPLNENFLLGINLRAWVPLYRLWTNENAPAIDGWRFGLGLRITPRKTKPDR